MPDFESITISLASPEQIREQSAGEVTSPKISPEYEKYEEDGLFCEGIFGPTQKYECRCGKHKGIRYNGTTCEQCGVEVARTHVYRCQCGRCTGTGYRNITCPQCGTEVVRQGKRRSRMGHISLSVPVVHSWYFKTQPNKIGALLGLTSKALEKVIYYEKYIVIQPGSAAGLGTEECQLLTEEERYEVLSRIREDNEQLPDEAPEKFIAETGGEAIETMLGRLDLDTLVQDLQYQIQTETSQDRKDTARKRLEVAEAFRDANRDGENRPEWMVLRALPVVPPDLRPLVESDGDFVTSGLNELYRSVLIRNDRLQRLMEIQAPEVILRKEKRMLQEAVDSLLDNSRADPPAQGPSDRPLKSLSDRLTGKKGRFRQNLLGKRVDYSGRSVIVSGPHLELHQCGLPKKMAVELFKPFIIRRLIGREIVTNKDRGEKYIEEREYAGEGTEAIWEILEKELQLRPVLLNRAPTLHRLSVQAFEPVLTESKAIELHPLVCPAYNADFDGDQMAVHVPLSPEACLESIDLMLSRRNVLSPADGNPVAAPTQDMILGLYNLTRAKDNQKGEGMCFASTREVRQAYDQGVAYTHAKIALRNPSGSGEKIATTVGRVLFNETLPAELGYVNEVITTKNIRPVIARVLKETGFQETADFLDAVKDLGFRRSTMSGTTFSLSDVIIPEEKETLIEEADTAVTAAEQRHSRGLITDAQRSDEVRKIWRETATHVSEALLDALKEDRGGFNPIYMMADSGARGSKEQIRQLGGLRGLMARPQKRDPGDDQAVLKTPVRSNFKEGLSAEEYFISTHGSRKGLADMALKTADAGYLTRRLVEVGQRVTVTQQDCEALRKVSVEPLREQDGRGKEPGEITDEEPLVKLHNRVVGRVAARDVRDPETGDLLAQAGELIGEATAEAIGQSSIEKVEIRSLLTCEADRGVCATCYGRHPATQQMVEVGEPVGTVAAQAVGEPGTQLTLRTFHTGGTAGDDITGGLPRLEDLFEARAPEDPAVLSKTSGTAHLKQQGEGPQIITVTGPDGETEKSYEVPSSRHSQVAEGESVEAGTPLTSGPVHPQNPLEIEGMRAAQKHLLREVQTIYQQHGVEVAGKHFECLLRQMTNRVRITEPGDATRLDASSLSKGAIVHRRDLVEANAKLHDRFVVTDPGKSERLKAGQIASRREIYRAHFKLKEDDEPGIETRPARLAVGQPLLLGLTETGMNCRSWVSAASFQNTTKVLSKAAIAAETDLLDGIKETVAVGRTIPAGTGQGKYRGLSLNPEALSPEPLSPEPRSAERESGGLPDRLPDLSHPAIQVTNRWIGVPRKR